MNAREQGGLAIAATTKLENANSAWLTPSQSGHGRHIVKPLGEGYRGNCPMNSVSSQSSGRQRSKHG